MASCKRVFGQVWWTRTLASGGTWRRTPPRSTKGHIDAHSPRGKSLARCWPDLSGDSSSVLPTVVAKPRRRNSRPSHNPETAFPPGKSNTTTAPRRSRPLAKPARARGVSGVTCPLAETHSRQFWPQASTGPSRTKVKVIELSIAAGACAAEVEAQGSEPIIAKAPIRRADRRRNATKRSLKKLMPLSSTATPDPVRSLAHLGA